MKILLIGKDGQIGKYLFNTLKYNHDVLPLGRKECNLLVKDEIISVFKNISADLVINAAAYTDVDKAENDEKKAFLINSDAVKIISILTKENNIPFINYSTDYVFDGQNNKEYLEEDKENPLNVYGRSKLSGEKNTKINEKHVIIRTSSVFSLSGNNFIKKIINLAENQDRLNVVNDQIITPTSTELISNVTNKLISYIEACKNKDIFGTYHLVAQGSCSWYDYAKVIVEEAFKNGHNLKVSLDNIHAISSNDFKSDVNRPKNSVLCTDKIKSLLSIEIPEWQKDVKQTIQTIIKNK